MAQEQVKIMRNVVASMKIWFQCSYCPQKFDSENARNMHYRARHAEFLPMTSSIVKHAKNQLTTNECPQLAAPEKLCFGCSYCLQKFQSADARDNHQEVEHIQSSVLNTSNRHKRKEMAKSAVNRNRSRSRIQPQSDLFNDKELSVSLDHTSMTHHFYDSTKNISCWQCSMKFNNVKSRLNHFLRYHTASFIPDTNVVLSHIHTHTNTGKEQTHNSAVLINSFGISGSCWKCGYELKSPYNLMFHIITKHVRTILYTDIDPSIALKNELLLAQKRMKPKNTSSRTMEALVNGSQYSEKVISIVDDTKYVNNKHDGSPLPTTSKISKCLNNQTTEKQIKIPEHMSHPVDKPSDGSICFKEFISTANHSDNKNTKCPLLAMIMSSSNVKSKTEISPEHSENTMFKTNALHISYYCHECQKQFTCATDHVEHFKTEHIEVTPSIKPAQICLTNCDIMKCPKATFPTLVYISLETIRKQICITTAKTNRCPHEACKSTILTYTFEQLSSHINTNHKNAQLKLECCNPMITYTLEEYKKHILYAD